MAARLVNLEWGRLQPHTVPMVCAKTGVPATRLRRHLLVQRRQIRWWMFLLLPVVWVFLLTKAFGHRAKIVLPITTRVLWRHRALRALMVLWFFLGGSVLATVLPDLAVVVGWVLGLVVLHRLQRAAWVRPRWRGMVQLRNPHAEFLSAVRSYPLRQQVVTPPPEPGPAAKPDPGWYPDPGGVHAARWFDGGGWTEHVLPHS